MMCLLGWNFVKLRDLKLNSVCGHKTSVSARPRIRQVEFLPCNGIAVNECSNPPGNKWGNKKIAREKPRSRDVQRMWKTKTYNTAAFVKNVLFGLPMENCMRPQEENFLSPVNFQLSMQKRATAELLAFFRGQHAKRMASELPMCRQLLFSN
jgi:hypothetical protein